VSGPRINSRIDHDEPCLPARGIQLTMDRRWQSGHLGRSREEAKHLAPLGLYCTGVSRGRVVLFVRRDGPPVVKVPESAPPHGFSNTRAGAFSSRTLMLRELRRLLADVPAGSLPDAYHIAVVEENVLLKQTQDSRVKTYRYLRDRYGLDPRLTLFRTLVDLWQEDEEAQPLLALLAAAARDPLIRATSDTVLDLPVGARLVPSTLAAVIDTAFPDAYRPSTLAAIGQRAASSWQQAGHLSGHVDKVRARAICRPTAVAYALLLGHLCGTRGEMLYQTRWARLVDVSTRQMREQASDAAQRGWIEVRQAGGVTEIGFRHLLRHGRGKG